MPEPIDLTGPAVVPTTRDPVLDVARGVAMVLIVLGHVTRGLAASGDLDASRHGYVVLDTVLYLVHLPVFMVLSGCFVARAVARDGAGPYLRSRLLLLAWIFVVWTIVQGTVQVAAGRLTNTPISWHGVVAGMWHPLGQLWFLPALAVLTTVTVLVGPWRSPARRNLLLVGAGAVSLADWGHFGHWSGTQGMGLAICYVAGVVLGQRRLLDWVHHRRLPVTSALCAVCFVLLFLILTPVNPSDSSLPRTPWGVAAGVVGVLLGLGVSAGVARLLASSPLGRPLAVVGRRSLEVFLAHITFASGSRILLTHLGIEDTAVLIGVGVAAGLTGSLLLVVVAERCGLRWLFLPPRRLSRAAVRA